MGQGPHPRLPCLWSLPVRAASSRERDATEAGASSPAGDVADALPSQ
jgi:hypothetical protein